MSNPLIVWRPMARLASLCALLIGALAAPTARAVLTCSNFEIANQNGTFSLGNSPRQATFSGGVVETRGIGALYHSGLKSWHVDGANGEGTIDFESRTDQVTLFFKEGTPSPNSVLSVTNTDGDTIFSSGGSTIVWTEVIVATQPGEAPIFQVKLTNSSNGTVVIDDICWNSDPAQSPQAAAGDDIAVADDDDNGVETVTLDATSSNDPDGEIQGYEWSIGGQVIANGASPDVDLAIGVHEILLTIDDDDGLEDTDTLTVIVFARSVMNLLPVPDVNGNSSPDAGALILDLDNAAYVVVLKDGLDAAAIRTLNMGAVNAIAAAGVPDANGNQTTEVAVLRKSFDDNIAADVFDTSDGSVIRTISFANAFAPVAFGVVDNIDGGGNPALVTLGVNGNGDVRAQVKQVSSGALIRTVQFAPAFAPKFMVVVPDVSGNGIPELAVLGIDGSGNIRVQLKDAATGTLIHWIQFAKAFDPKAMVMIPDGPGGPAIAVLGVHVDGRVSAQIKDATTRQPVHIGRVNFGRKFVFSHMTRIGDLSGNGVSEIVYLGIDAGGTVRAQIKDPVTRQQVKLVFFAKTFPPEDIASFLNIGGSNADELGVIGTNSNNGNRRVQIKDGLTNAEIVLIPVP